MYMLAQLDALRDVEIFGLAGSRISDAGLAQWLGHLKEVTSIANAQSKRIEYRR